MGGDADHMKVDVNNSLYVFRILFTNVPYIYMDPGVS